MRILFITGRYSYGDSKRGEAYEHQNFLPALRRLGHEVEILDSLLRSEYSDFIALNRAVLRKVEEWKPDLVLYVQVRYEIWTETWDIIRKSGIAATVNWAADDSWKYSQASRFIAKHFDACITTYADKIANYHLDGYKRVMESQWAADLTQSQPPVAAADCRYDVSFVGACYGSRSRFVETLKDAGIAVECFGYGWPNGPIDGNQIAPILRNSRITLNFSGSGKLSESFVSKHRQIKARVFEVPGAGGFLLTEWARGIERYYDIGREIDVFRTDAELIEKAKFYLAHPAARDKCARSAYDRTKRDHTYDLRMTGLVDFAIEQRNIFREGTGQIDWKAFDVAALRHTVNSPLLLIRNALANACTLLFGARRGPRAARQLLFEFSWRICGERTYSSSGLPGRLFYHDS